jgi:hypothetical protein
MLGHLTATGDLRGVQKRRKDSGAAEEVATA